MKLALFILASAAFGLPAHANVFECQSTNTKGRVLAVISSDGNTLRLKSMPKRNRRTSLVLLATREEGFTSPEGASRFIAQSTRPNAVPTWVYLDRNMSAGQAGVMEVVAITEFFTAKQTFLCR
jgi:hypothetical protein